MIAIIKTEFQKMKRYHILLIGMAGMLCSPLLQYFSQQIVIEEARNPHFNFAALIDNTIWGNVQIFMPVLFTLTGGYLINREYADDTIKNILAVPISFRRLLAGKLAAVGLLSILFGIYSLAITVIVSICAGLSDICFSVFINGLLRMIVLSACVYIVVLPIITFCAHKPGLFMAGSVIAFIAGYCVLFFKKGLLRNIYPFSAALTIIGFDASSYTGAPEKGSVPLAYLSLGSMLLISVLSALLSKMPETAGAHKKNKKNAALRPAQREKIHSGKG